jgi:hypothetical protein
MNARIVRLEQTSEGAIGVLLLDSKIFCFTLEPDLTETKKFQIPQGEYLCKRFHGIKWTNTFEIVVEGHTAVLFHAGNTEADSRGCVLLGSTVGKLKGNRAILNSGATFEEFMNICFNLMRFNLVIEEHYGN